jgi:hypothetical protein
MTLTKKEINEVQFEPSSEGNSLPVVANWLINVNGREFGEYMSLARRKPRRSILFLPIAYPCSTFANIWGTIATVNDFTYTAFIVALSLAFNDYSDPNAYWYLDFIGSAIYICDLLFEFHVGFIVRWDSSSVTLTDGILVAKNYIRRGTFWIDAVACIPIIGQIFIATTGDTMTNASIRSILLLKLLRLLRVVRLVSRMNRFENADIIHQWIAARVNSVTMFACNIFFSLMVMVNLLACLWWWIAVTQGVENSWVAAVAISKPDIDLENGSNWVRWLVCAYYSLVTMATIGYGDIVPVTSLEIGIVIIFIFCGVAFFGFVLSTVKNLLESGPNDDAMGGGDYSKFQEMESWMKRFSLPKGLQRDIRKHCYAIATSSALTTAHVSDFYSSLPLWLKVKVAIELQRNGLITIVGGQKVWDALPEDTRNAVAKIVAVLSEPEILQSNSKVYTVGDKCNHIYFLEEGQLGLYVPGVAQVITVSSPAVMGTGSLFASWSDACSTWKATGRTGTRCYLWKVNSALLLKELMDVAPDVLQLILDHYVEELRKTREQLDTFAPAAAHLPGIIALKKSYDVRLEGALLAYDDVNANVQKMQQAAELEALRSAVQKSGEVANMDTLQRLAGEGVEVMETEVIEGMSNGQVVAARLLELEMQNTLNNEIDLEQNDSSVRPNLGEKLDRRQESMYIEHEEIERGSTSAAAGVLRKEGNTTFVV